MSEKEANMIDAYVSAVGVYASAVKSLANRARKQNGGAWEAARVGVNNSRRKTERARLALRIFQGEPKRRKTSGNTTGYAPRQG
jgi:hypothetical protein